MLDCKSKGPRFDPGPGHADFLRVRDINKRRFPYIFKISLIFSHAVFVYFILECKIECDIPSNFTFYEELNKKLFANCTKNLFKLDWTFLWGLA